MLFYPASTLHRVTPVIRGLRVSSFFWIQSMVRSDQQQALLFELDGAIQSRVYTRKSSGSKPGTA